MSNQQNNIPGRVRDLELTMRQLGLSFINLNITCTSVSNDLVLAVKTDAGDDPSAGDPVIVRFRVTTSSITFPEIQEITSPLSLTMPAGASLAIGDGEAGTFQVALFLNSSGIQLAVTRIQNSFYSSPQTSVTAISAGADSITTTYATSGGSSGIFTPIGLVTVTRGTNQWPNNPTVVFTTPNPLNIRDGAAQPRSIVMRNDSGNIISSRDHRFLYTPGTDFTLALQILAGSAPSFLGQVVLPFRSNTHSTSGLTFVPFTAATSITVVGGATLGFATGQEGFVYVWAAYDGTNKELAVSRTWKDITKLHSTTAVSTSADTSTAIYTSTTSMSNAALYPLGRICIEYTTNDWDAATPAFTPTVEEYVPDWLKTRDIFQAGPCVETGTAAWTIDVFVGTTYTWHDQIAVMPASNTGDTILPIAGLEQRDHITGFWLNGRVESAGNTVTVGDISLVKVTYAAASATRTVIKTFASFNVTTDTLLSVSNTLCLLDAPEPVTSGNRYYLEINGVTDVATEIYISNAVVRVN